MMNETSLPESTNALSAEVAVSTPPDGRMRRGKAFVIAGWGVTILGIVLYCAVCLTAGVNDDFGEVLLDSVDPFARATLVVMGIGTLLWLVGSLVYLRAAMDADDTRPFDRKR